MTNDMIVRDLARLAHDTALLHAYFEEEERNGHTPRRNLICFMERTFAHNQRRHWEKNLGHPLPPDPTREKAS